MRPFSIPPGDQLPRWGGVGPSSVASPGAAVPVPVQTPADFGIFGPDAWVDTGPVICPRCGSSFQPVKSWQRWCSPTCRKAACRHRAAEAWAAEKARQMRGPWTQQDWDELKAGLSAVSVLPGWDDPRG